MTRLIDAIRQFKSKALDNRNEEHYWKTRLNLNANCLEYAQKACKSAEKNEQIVTWLEELVNRRESDRWNVIHTEADLPKEDGFYLTTVEYVESISGKLKRNTAELYFSTVFKSWSECGEDEDSDDDIIAWRPLPEYKESEAENE